VAGSGSGVHAGVQNTITGTGAGAQYGTMTTISNSVNGNHFGTMNILSGLGTGIHYGTRNDVTGTGLNYGTYNTVSSTANTAQTGTNNIVSGTGTGQKIGTYNFIDPTAGGTHYGIVSYALKAGSYAGYFQGNVAIGTNVGNPYILPPSRGLNGQIMQSDGVGNVTWQNPGNALNSIAWLTTGNGGLASGTNFLGTTDNVAVAFRTVNIERMRLLTSGAFVVNSVAAVAGDVFSTFAAGTNYAINGYATGTGTSGYFENTGGGDAVNGVKDGTAGSAAFFLTNTGANANSTVDIYNLSGVAPALSVVSSSANINADGIQIDLTGGTAKRGIEMTMSAATPGLGIAVFHAGNSRPANFQSTHATTTEPALFVQGVSPNSRLINVQNTSAASTTTTGFFSQASTGQVIGTYQNAGSVWGQSQGIRSGIFLAAGASANTTVLQAGYSGITGNFDGVGVYGRFAPAAAYGYGVVGEGNFFGMLSLGDSGATGVKAFQIDHPLDPENKYLRHYSMESPEVLNMYRGNVVLDANGEATVILPSYFDAININCSYHLTAIGSPSNPYIKEEIQGNQFKVAGGNPGQKISWQVFAERNDAYLQQNPEKRAVEMEKKTHDKGLYLQPKLYNLPESKSIFNRYKSDPSKVKVEEAAQPHQSKAREIVKKDTRVQIDEDVKK
jgi:hypothetical protein